MMMDSVLEPVEGIQAYQRLCTLLDDSRSPLEIIHAQLSNMPVAAARIVSAANLPIHSGAMPIDRLDRAVILLGRETVGELCRGMSEMATEESDIAGFDLKNLVRHHVVVSRAAELVAHAARLPLAQEARAAALFHDLGIFVQLRSQPDEFRLACTEARTTRSRLTEHEGLLCERDHCDAGAGLIADWGLPESLVRAVEFHHDPLSAPNRHRYLAILIYAAECLAKRAGFADLFGDDALQLEHRILEELRLDDLILRAHVPVLRRMVADADQCMALEPVS
ncbi:MAG: HDOD domain-containing protein [Planctomycetes bacterium]|nr:HDOD domain-containing protein [Planctomycetota bacterium]